jgi:hypothetical protein
MSDKIQLHIGYVGATREGKRVEILNCTHDNIYSWRGNNNETYTHCGSFSSNRNDARDIVGPWVREDYNDGNWHRWEGGRCPIHGNSEVNILTKERTYDCKASEYPWNHPTDSIIAFKVIQVYTEPREFWIYNGSVSWGIKTEKPDDMYGYIHVREVVE